MIFLLREASFIQPSFPPNLEQSEILNFEAEFSNPSLDIEFLISLYFFDSSFLFDKVKTISERS